MAELHPLAVHLPITLILIWPLLDLAGHFFGKKDLSLAALALLLLALAASLLATLSGQAAYDRALSQGVNPELLHGHTDNAELIPWLLLVIATSRVFLVQKFGPRAQLFAITLGFLLAGLVFSVGRSGGRLVFEHGVGVDVGGTHERH